MKNILYIFLFTLAFTSCEKDDFCTTTTPLTPQLILRFYDSANPDTLKEATFLSVWAQGKDTLVAYTSIDTDSIAIPLNTLDLETVYFLKTNTSTGDIADNTINKITINYTTEDVFISRACGYKTIFNEVLISSDNVWFQSITPTNLTTIDSEQNAHIKIFH